MKNARVLEIYLKILNDFGGSINLLGINPSFELISSLEDEIDRVAETLGLYDEEE